MKRSSLLGVFAIALALAFGPVMVAVAAQSAGGMIDDSTITAAVKAKLAKDVRLGTLTGIEVNTTDGVVTLAGKVKSMQEKTAVSELVNGVDGVKSVKNNLQVIS